MEETKHGNGMGKGRRENLIDAAHRTEEELREMTRKGGIKSGEVRRRKKTMRQALEMLLYDVKLDEQTKDRLRAQGIEEEEHMNHQMVITRSLIAKAEAGDVQAYHAVCAMIGEKPVEQFDVSGDLLRDLRVTRYKREDDKPSGLISHSEDEVQD